jgi:Tfp pilus assembly protein PilZ
VDLESALVDVHFSYRIDDIRCMPSPEEVAKLLPLVREYGILERKRTGNGVTPDEFIRWSQLRARLEDKFPQGDTPPGAERRETLRLPTRMLVEFRGEGDLQAALIRNISRGGLFISTPVNPAIGTELKLLMSIGDVEKIELPVIVASSGVLGPGGATGLGCKFGRLDAAQQAIVDEMFATALDAEK